MLSRLLQGKYLTTVSYFRRQISKEFYAIDLEGGDARLIISRDGTVHLKMKTNVFKSRVILVFFISVFAVCNEVEGSQSAAKRVIWLA